MTDHSRPTLSRRRLLAAAGVAGVGVTGVGAAVAVNRSGDGTNETSTTSGKGFVPFEGVHQSGIVTPHQQHGLVAAFNVTAPDRESLVEMFKSLTATRARRHGRALGRTA